MNGDAIAWTIEACGPLRLTGHRPDGSDHPVALRPKERAVVAALALDHPNPVSIDAVVERVWGARAPANAVTSTRNHVTRTRRAAPGLVVTVGSGYALSSDVTVRYDRRGGEVLADLADVPEVRGRRLAIGDRLAAEVDHGLVDALAGPNPPGPHLLEQLRLAVDDEPYRETRWAVLAMAQALAGQRRESLLTLQSARSHLAEVGLDPGARLIRVETAILGGEAFDARQLLRGAPPAPPVTVHPHRDEPFSGRDGELAALATAWEDTLRSGRPGLVIVEGPAGSGKTRLADRFIAHLLDGADPPRVVWGRHRASAQRAHGALAEAVARLFAAEPALAAEPMTQQLRRLVALDDAGATGAPGSDVAADADVAFVRTQLGRELARVVALVGRRPTIWLIDDLQWAEADSLALVEEAFDGAPGPVLLVVTARSGSPAIAEAVATLGRIMPTAMVQLTPLAPTDLGGLVRAATEQPVGDDVVEVLHRRTGGLALYVSEILRQARRSGVVDLATVPAAIRDWIQHRLHQLDPEVARTLQLAAVADDVDLDLVGRASGLDRGRIVAHWDALHTAGLLAVDGRTGVLGFSHEITREAVAEAIGPVQRAELDRAVAEALLDLRPGEHDRIAIHFDRARDGRAYAHARRAADAALAVGAWGHARVMSTIATAHAAGDGARAESLVGVGRALLASGDPGAARPVLEEAIELARAAGAAAAHARAALALVGRAGRGAINDDEDLQLGVLRAVLAHLGTADDDAEVTALRCDLERELAIALLLSDAAAERDALLRGALGRAQALRPANPRALAAATLGMRYALLGPGDLPERLEHTAAVLAMPEDALDHETRIAAWVYRHEDLRRAGRHPEADDALRRAEHVLTAYPHPYWTWAVRTWEALGHVIDGDLDRAESVAGAALALRPGVTEAVACLGVTLVDIRLHQGRAGEVVPMLRVAADANPHIPTYRAVLALCAAESGDHATARDALRWFAETAFDALPPDTNRFLGLSVLAHATATLGDTDAARVLLPLLEPYAGQWVVLSAYGGGGASWGPAAHGLARLAGVLGDGRATGWYDDAARMAAASPLALDRINADRAADPSR